VNTIPTADFSQKPFLGSSRWKSDFHQFRDTKLTVSDWAKNLLLYEDGRFAKDKMWPFYVLNFATRKKPNQREDISLMDFSKKVPKTLKICQNSRRRYFMD
jgi:hypothetical protein